MGQEQEKWPGALWQVWEQGLGPSEHSFLSGLGDTRLCSQAFLPAGWGRLCAPDGEVNFVHTRGWEGLTHTKCSLGVQLKALRTANLIFFCKAKGMTLRKPVPQGTLGWYRQGPLAGRSALVLNQTCDNGPASWLLAQVCWKRWLWDKPGLVDVPWGLSREARQGSRQTQEKPLERSRLFKVTCAKLCSGEPSSHAQMVAIAFHSQQEVKG